MNGAGEKASPFKFNQWARVAGPWQVGRIDNYFG